MATNEQGRVGAKPWKKEAYHSPASSTLPGWAHELCQHEFPWVNKLVSNQMVVSQGWDLWPWWSELLGKTRLSCCSVFTRASPPTSLLVLGLPWDWAVWFIPFLSNLTSAVNKPPTTSRWWPCSDRCKLFGKLLSEKSMMCSSGIPRETDPIRDVDMRVYICEHICFV